MVCGTNMATCSQCGRGYLTGDSIDLGGKCDKCKYTKIVDLTHLVPTFEGGSKEKLKQVISAITNDALAGVEAIYRYKEGEMSYIRWGVVAKHIDAAIDLYWPKEEKEDE